MPLLLLLLEMGEKKGVELANINTIAHTHHYYIWFINKVLNTTQCAVKADD